MSPARHVRAERGVALIAVLLVSSLVFLAGTGLALVTMLGQLVARNHRDAAVMQAAAHAGVELAADALSGADWQAVLQGTAVADTADGPPSGRRTMSTTTVDLAAETDTLNCGRPTPCSGADRAAISADRPWGANNPHWQLFLYGPLAPLAGFRFPPLVYLLVWVADDGRETDDRPEVDGGDDAGRHIVRVRSLAIAADGARRAVDAELVRICLEGRIACESGIRVQSEREARHGVP